MTETDDILTLFQHHVGKTEVPPEFFTWSCLSMIAACVSDRVWLEWFRGSYLYPNLYVFLIGPSGCGKGRAISEALKFTNGLPQDRFDYYRGRLTGPYLLSYLARLNEAKTFLVTPELSMSIYSKDLALDLIKIMTDLFDGSDYPIKTGTQTRGLTVLHNPCMNWIAGSTKEWLLPSVSRDAITGGFFARACAIVGQYPNVRIYEPSYPPDYDDCVIRLQRRFKLLVYAQGPFRISSEAHEWFEHWYNERPSPTDEIMMPAFARERALVHKLAMLCALSRGADLEPGLVIERSDAIRAERLLRICRTSLPSLITYASTTKETQAIQTVRDLIRDSGRIHHSILLKRVTNRGISAKPLAEIISTLVQAKEIRVKPGVSGRGRIYEWRRRLSTIEAPSSGEDEAESA